MTPLAALIEDGFEIRAATVAPAGGGQNTHFIYLPRGTDVYVVTIRPDGAQGVQQLG